MASSLTGFVPFRTSMLPRLTRIIVSLVRYRCPNVFTGFGSLAAAAAARFDLRSSRDNAFGDELDVESADDATVDGEDGVVHSASRLAMSI